MLTFCNNDLVMRQIFLLLPWELALTASKRNLTDKRYSDILQILTSTELRIGAFTDEEDSDMIARPMNNAMRSTILSLEDTEIIEPKGGEIRRTL